MKTLEWKIKTSRRVLGTSFKKFKASMAIAWTGGKDSTVLLHMIKTSKEDVDIPVMFIDTGLHFKETYDFVELLSQEWNLKLIKVKDKSGLKKYKVTRNRTKKKEIARTMKINAIKKSIKRNKWKALIVGIRWDEHQARSNEVYFSPRKDHMRIHPILHFTEKDIWDYIRKFNLPYNPLYDKGYRSLGLEPFTNPVLDKSQSERSGRDKDKEAIMERLRSLGYF